MDPEDFINMMNNPSDLAVLQQAAGIINQQGAMAILNKPAKVVKNSKPEPEASEPVGYDINRPYNKGPNFTILVPGACNAKSNPASSCGSTGCGGGGCGG